MKRKITERIKEKKGITLIALVITIIVLLILAAVSIATLTGQNGILTQANNAKEETRGATVEEIVELWRTENEMNDYYDSSETPKSEDELLQELLGNKQVFEEEIDRESKTITIGDRVISYKIKSQLTDIYVALYNDGTLVFSNKNDFDANLIADGWNVENIKGKKYELEMIPEFNIEKLPPWFMKNVQEINFASKIVPENIVFWFFGLSDLKNIENMNNLDTSNVTNMADMFYGCSSLSNIDLTCLDTSNVTNMADMFYRCNSLSNIDLTGLDTSNVTNMASMFYGCNSLSNIDLTGLDTSNVTSMSSMFSDCSQLSNLDVSSLDTSSVTTMNGMFSNCSSLTSIDLSKFKTSEVTNMIVMFSNCSGLTKLDVSNFDITYMKANPTKVQRMFQGVTCPVTINSEWTEEMKTESEYKEQ